jgi:arsenate reductase (glutaredoxin)
MIIYGIKNCNTVKSALEWLKKHNFEYELHDYKAKGISQSRLKSWCDQVGWERLVNKKGMTWRQLTEKEQAAVTSQSKAVELMAAKTSVIKRPLIEKDNKVLVLGFDEKEYAKVFG